MDSAVGLQASPWRGCPIRRSPDHSLLAAPRGLSQPSTSFIGSRCQGIHRAPLLARRLDLSTPPSRQDLCPLASSLLLLFVRPRPHPRPQPGAQRRSVRFVGVCLLNYSALVKVPRDPARDPVVEPAHAGRSRPDDHASGRRSSLRGDKNGPDFHRAPQARQEVVEPTMRLATPGGG